MFKKAISIFILLLLLFINLNSILAFNYSQINNSIKKENNRVLWAVFVTVGEPERDGKNTQDLYDILLKNGWNEENILIIQEEKATKEEIYKIPDWLNDNGLNEEDLLLFYFSMHGGKTQDKEPYDEPDGMDEFLVPYKEGQDNGTNILDDELSLVFNEIQSNNMLIIIEACYAGGMIDGYNDLKKTGRVIITSCGKNESSYPIFLKKTWLFPFYYIKGLNGPADKNQDNMISAEESFNYARIRTIRRSTIYAVLLFIFHKSLFIQHPQIYDGWPSEQNNNEELNFINL